MLSDIKYIKLLKALKDVMPEHDTAVGLIHPYWARKPMNVTKCIIESLSNEGDTILDPFMGSGTTIFSSLSLGRSAIGSDINPLSVFLVKTILTLKIDKDDLRKSLELFMNNISILLLPLYQTSPETFIERERYQVNGEFEYGNYNLELVELVTKKYISGKWTSRTTITKENELKNIFIPDKYKKYLKNPINFENIPLLHNSRIAIPKGASLSHFFTQKNIIAINLVLDYIDKKVENKYQNIYKLLLSSCLPLLRLSDKKASSQWPYWRPKNHLTSRNPIMMFRRRINSLVDACEWVSTNLPEFEQKPGCMKTSQSMLSCSICESSIQKLDLKSLAEIADLVLTDPPYSDQAPYLEYSALWAAILGFTITDSALNDEIVKSDAENRNSDHDQYLKNLNHGMDLCCKMVRPGGYLVWFYQDYNLKTWYELSKSLAKNNMSIVDIIPINKQRRSMKTVTSPGDTLDGDLICVFKKHNKDIAFKKNSTFDKKRVASEMKLYKNDLYKQYTIIIKESLIENSIGDLSKSYNNIREVIRDLN